MKPKTYVGVQDLSQYFVIPAIYDHISWTDGIFACIKGHANPEVRYFDHNGSEVKAGVEDRRAQYRQQIAEAFAKKREQSRKLVNGLRIYENDCSTDDTQKLFGLKNAAGEVVLEAKYYEISDHYSEGAVPVRVTAGGVPAEFTYVDETGKELSPRYWRAFAFEKERAIVAVLDNEAIPFNRKSTEIIGGGNFGRWGVIDRDFNWVVEPKYSSITRYGRTFSACKLEDGEFVPLDLNGSELRTIPEERYVRKILDRDEEFSLEVDFAATSTIIRHGEKFIELAGRYSAIRLLGPHSLVAFSDSTKAIAPPVVLNRQLEVLTTLPCIDVLRAGPRSVVLVEDRSKLNSIAGSNLSFYDYTGRLKRSLTCKVLSSIFSDYLIVETGDQLQGLLDLQGNWLVEPKKIFYKEGPAERVIVEVLPTTFDQVGWLNGENCTFQNFDLLLRNYSLIGMPKEQLETLIGPVKHEDREGPFYRCGYERFNSEPASRLQIAYNNNNCVEKWRIYQNRGCRIIMKLHTDGTMSARPFWVTRAVSSLSELVTKENFLPQS